MLLASGVKGGWSEPVGGGGGGAAGFRRWVVRETARTAYADDLPCREAPRVGEAEPAVEAVDPEAVDPADELFVLGERCAETYMRSDALQHEAMVLLAEYDAREGWRDTGFGSTAEWLAWRIGIKAGAARERVRTARALVELPQTAAALRAGEVSFTKVRALTRVARPENEATLLELACSCSAAQLERRLRAWTSEVRSAEAVSEERRHRRRTFSVFPGEDGMYVVRGLLEPEVGAVLMRAVEAASDALYRREARGGGGEGADGAGPEGGSVAGAAGCADCAGGADVVAATPEQRRADAVGLMAERALAAGFSDGPLSGSRAERYQVMLHVDEAALRAEAAAARATDPTSQAAMTRAHVSAETSGRAPGRVSAETFGRASGRVSAERSGGESARGSAEPSRAATDTNGAGLRPRSELEDGVRLSAETSRRLACDAAVVRITRGGRVAAGAQARDGCGSVLDVGRRTRTIPPALRRALEARDRGCRFPACGSRFTDGHHIVHWVDGGPTRLENLMLLCRRHHRAVHEGRVRVCRGADDSVAFFTPRGRSLHDAPPRGTGASRSGGRDGTGQGPDGRRRGELGHRGPEGLPPLVRAVTVAELRLDRPSYRCGAARWADRDVPLAIELRALNAIENRHDG